MNNKKLLIYMVIILAIDSTSLLNINNYENAIHTNKNSIDEEKNISIKLLSSPPIDSSWIVIDTSATTAVSLDYIINNYIAQGKTKFYIKDGTYNLNDSIRINLKDVIVCGQSKEHTKIVQLNTGKNNIEVTADNVHVQNLTINNEHGEIAFTAKDSDYVTLEDCIIYGSPNNSAVAFWGRTGVNDIDAVNNNNLTSNNIIRGNTVHSSSTKTKDGLTFMKQKNGILENNTLIGSRIAFYLCRDSDVNSNIIKNSSSGGIRVTVPAYDNKIFNNTIDNTLESGISVVRNDSSATGITYRASNIQIISNNITNSRYFGIEIANLSNSSIYGNTISNIDFDGIYLLYADNLNVNNNIISNIGLTTNGVHSKLFGWDENLNSGIFIDYSVCNSSIDSNEITNPYNKCIHGIRMQSGGSNLQNSIINNTIAGNFSTGIDATTNSPENTYIYGNNINLNTTSAPANLTAVSSADNITLSWDPVTGITDYQLEVDGIIISNITSTSYVNTSLINNTTHKYRVRATGGNWSPFVTATTLQADAPTLTAIPDITNIKLNWNSVAGAAEYEIERDGNIIDTITSTNYISTGLTSNSSYNYRVRSVGGKWSSMITTTTLQDPPVISPVQPNTTTGPSVIIDPHPNSTTTGSSVTIDPNPHNTTTGSSVTIDPGPHSTTTGSSATIKPDPHSTTTGPSVTIKPDPHSTATGSSPVITPTKTRRTSKSSKSKIPFITLSTPQLPAPTNIATVSSVNNIMISWNSVLGSTGYEIEVNGKIINTEANISYMNTGLISNTTYKYRVRSIGGIWSDYIIATTLPLSIQPPNLTIQLVPNSEDTTSTPEARITSPETPSPKLEQLINLEKDLFEPTEPTEPVLIPTNITATCQVDSITINWDVVSGAIGYEIEVDGEIVDNENNTSYVHANLTSNTTHSYRVRINGMTWSELQTVRTLSENNIDTNKDDSSINIDSVKNTKFFTALAIILAFLSVGFITLKKFLRGSIKP